MAPPMPATASSPVAVRAKQADRLAFVDNIRWVLIVVVICHHAAVTYSHVGGWYYLDGPEPPLGVKVPFIAFETYDQAYFMGFLFLLAGFFVPRAYDNKGALRFLRDRFVRLGVPSLIFMLIFQPVIVYWLLRRFYEPERPSLASAYGPYIVSGRVLSGTGPMWFAVALLIFCCGYVMLRQFVPAIQVKDLPSHVQVAGLIVLLGACTFAVRTVQPIGTNVFNMQLCYFSQYVTLFAIGVLAYRGNWLQNIPYRFGILWFKLACWIGVPSFFLVLAVSGALRGHADALLGGWHWPSALFALWESFFCLAMCLGLTVLFRERFNICNSFTSWMTRNSFTAYLLHTPILIAITLSLRALHAPVGIKFLCACIFAVPVTFGVSGVLRPLVPGLRRIL